MKAALKLHKPAQRADIDLAAHRRLADEAVRRAPTRVKDTQSLLPLDPGKHRRILVFSTGIVFPSRPIRSNSRCPTCSDQKASR